MRLPVIRFKDQSIAFLKRYGYVLMLLVVQATVFYRWLFWDSLFTFGDVGVYPLEAQKNLVTQALSIYNAHFSLGEMNIAASSNPFTLFYGLLSYIGIDPIWSEKIALFYPIIFGSVLSSYSLVEYLTKSKRAAFLGAINYAYSIPFLITLTGALYLSLAYAFAPFLFLTFIRALEQPSLKRWVRFALVSIFYGFLEFRMFYILFWMMTIYLSLFLYISKDYNVSIMKCIRKFVFSGLFILLANLFWIIPMLIVDTIINNELFSRGLFGEQYFNFLNSFVVFHPWWTWETPSVFYKQTAPIYFYVFPLLVLTLLFLRFRDKRMYIFYIFLLLGIFLTKQSAVPFESIYGWLYTHLPGFNAFREPSKFYVISSLATTVLFGYLVMWLERNSFLKKWYKYLISMGIFVAISIFILNARTIMSGEIGTMFIPREFPSEYVELNNFISSRDSYYRNLWFPHINRFGLYTDQHPAVSLLMNIDTFYKRFSNEEKREFESYLYSPFKDDQFRRTLERQSIRYIIMPSNLVWDEIDSPWRDPENYKDDLDRVDFLKRISSDSLERKNIFIYENTDARPRIYLTEKPESTYSNVIYHEVGFDSNGTTEYHVQVKNIIRPVYLNFTDKYHSSWKLRTGAFQWFNAIIKKDYFLPEMFHFENEVQLNSFLIDPDYIKKNLSKEQYSENQDGSIDLNLTLYFKPQSYFYLGAIISGTTIIGSLGYLGWLSIRKRIVLCKGKE